MARRLSVTFALIYHTFVCNFFPAVRRQIKPGILNLTTRTGQGNFSIVFIFVRFKEKGYYRVVSVGQLCFDCRSYCVRSRRTQDAHVKIKCEKWYISYLLSSCHRILLLYTCMY